MARLGLAQCQALLRTDDEQPPVGESMNHLVRKPEEIRTSGLMSGSGNGDMASYSDTDNRKGRPTRYDRT
jgi:hypothetical protein